MFVRKKRLLLPDGYWAKHVKRRWYLFDARGASLCGPEDAATVEAYAWNDAWRRLEQDLTDELVAFRSGTRPLQDLHRLRQYFRMLDAVDQVRGAARTDSLRRRGYTMVAAVAAACVIALTAAHLVFPGSAMKTRLRTIYRRLKRWNWPPAVVFGGEHHLPDRPLRRTG